MSEIITLSLPSIQSHELRALEECLDGSVEGAMALEKELEESVADLVARPFGAAFGSTQCAIECALLALGVRDGHEIVLPALAPPALVAAIARARARPLFVDADPRTLTVRGEAVDARCTTRTRLIVGATMHGDPTGLDELAAVASKFEIPLLEIVCGGLGGRLGRDPTGRFGRLSVVGLDAASGFLGASGAVVCTNDDALASTLCLLREGGVLRPRVDWERIGGVRAIEQFVSDPTLPLVAAAISVMRLRRHAEYVKRVGEIFEQYTSRLGAHPDILLPPPTADNSVAWSHFAIRLSDRYTRDERDSIVLGMLRHDIGVGSAVCYAPGEPASLATFGVVEGFPIAERAAHRLITLPFHPNLSRRDVDLTCQTLEVMIQRQSIMR